MSKHRCIVRKSSNEKDPEIMRIRGTTYTYICIYTHTHASEQSIKGIALGWGGADLFDISEDKPEEEPYPGSPGEPWLVLVKLF